MVQDPDPAQEAKRYRALLEQSPDMFGRYSLDGVILWVSGQSEVIYGYRPEEMMGRKAYEFFHPEDQEQIREIHQRSLVESGVVEAAYRVVRKDGEVRWVHAAGRAMRSEATGEVTEILVNTRDITRMREAQQMAAAAERLAGSILEHLPASAFVITLDNRYRYVNPHWERVTGRSNDSVAGRPIAEVWPAVVAERLVRLGQEVVEKKAAVELELDFELPGGPRQFHSVRFPILGAGGEILATAGVSLDVTEAQKQAHRAKESEKLGAVARLAGGIAHEFNNSLTVLMGYAQMIQMPSTTPEASRRYAAQIESAAQESAQLVRRLQAFAGKAPAQPRPMDLRFEVERRLAALRTVLGPEQELECVPGSGMAPVMADPVQLDTLLESLVEHARRVMPKGARLQLKVEAAGGWTVLEVCETGARMDRNHVFEPFRRLRTGADDLDFGLSCAYGVCTQLGGEIEIADAVEGRVSVLVRLPQPASVRTAG